MLNQIRTSTMFLILCVGCDTAAKQQQAEDARRAATAADLKQLGKSMHENQNKESSAGAANHVLQSSNDPVKE